VRLMLGEVAKPTYALVDRRLIFQAVLNVVVNSVKFTPPGGTVVLALASSESDGVKIVVRDTGIGIAPEDLKRVLIPFEQVETSFARKNGGSGLGLPYAKRLVELHNGTLAISSEPGKGTTVTISLPSSRLVTQAVPPPIRVVASHGLRR